MDYSRIKPKKTKRYIQYFEDGELVAVYTRQLPKRKKKVTRKEFEQSIDAKLGETSHE